MSSQDKLMATGEGSKQRIHRTDNRFTEKNFNLLVRRVKDLTEDGKEFFENYDLKVRNERDTVKKYNTAKNKFREYVLERNKASLSSREKKHLDVQIDAALTRVSEHVNEISISAEKRNIATEKRRNMLDSILVGSFKDHFSTTDQRAKLLGRIYAISHKFTQKNKDNQNLLLNNYRFRMMYISALMCEQVDRLLENPTLLGTHPIVEEYIKHKSDTEIAKLDTFHHLQENIFTAVFSHFLGFYSPQAQAITGNNLFRIFSEKKEEKVKNLNAKAQAASRIYLAQAFTKKEVNMDGKLLKPFTYDRLEGVDQALELFNEFTNSLQTFGSMYQLSSIYTAGVLPTRFHQTKLVDFERIHFEEPYKAHRFLEFLLEKESISSDMVKLFQSIVGTVPVGAGLYIIQNGNYQKFIKTILGEDTVGKVITSGSGATYMASFRDGVRIHPSADIASFKSENHVRQTIGDYNTERLLHDGVEGSLRFDSRDFLKSMSVEGNLWRKPNYIKNHLG